MAGDPNAFEREKRRSPRWRLTDEAWVILPGSEVRHACEIKDISLTGVRLANFDPSLLENGFSVVLASNRARLIPCRMVWHTDDLIGAEFIADGL